MGLTRRALLAAGAAGTALPGAAHAAAPPVLTAATRVLEILGKPARVFTLLGPDGKPGLAFQPGDNFVALFRNTLPESTLLHWHGLMPPPAQDGTPGLSGPAVLAGESAFYDFRLTRPASAWAHPLGLQQQRLMAAPIIVHGAGDRLAQEHSMLLADFAFMEAEAIAAALGGDAASRNGGKDSGGDDESIAYDAYLANASTLDDPEIVRVWPGEMLRLRIVNAACATSFTIDTGALSARLAAVDGRAVVPFDATLFPIAPGQRLDLWLRIPGPGAYPILAAAAGRAGRAGIFLATRGAPIARIAREGVRPGPMLDGDFEKRLAADHRLAAMRPDRRLAIRLEGQARPYAWRIAGDDLRVRAGERVEIAVSNATDRAQTLHLHGHVFEVVGFGETRLAGALRDTVAVPAGETLTLAFDADNPGAWLLHATHLYRLLAGMAAILRYDS